MIDRRRTVLYSSSSARPLAPPGNAGPQEPDIPHVADRATFRAATIEEPVDHVILTRFNLPSAGAESIVRAKEGWLRERIALFERYCLPSVLRQAAPRLRWIVYFDPESPRWLHDHISEHTATGAYSAIFRAEVSRADLLQDLDKQFDDRGPELITTNLDNDDALAADFTQRLHRQPRPDRPTAYYLVNGLIKSPTGLFAHYDRFNAFPSVRTTWEQPVTCWADWHNHLPRHVAVATLGGAPGWLQVVHGGNVTNRARGRLVAPGAHQAAFPGALDDCPAPTRMELVYDRAWHAPRRIVRDASRAIVKHAALAVLGRDGFERAKHVVASGRTTSPG